MDQLKAGEGACFYATGGVFRAYISHPQTGARYYCGDDLVLELMRQGFELLVSDDKSRPIGSTIVHKSEAPNIPPSILLKIGADLYEMQLSQYRTGSARFVIWGPFEKAEEGIEVEEVEQSLGDDNEADS